MKILFLMNLIIKYVLNQQTIKMNKEELKNKLKSITDKFVGKENNEETRQQVQDKLREYLEPIVTKYINRKYNIIVNEEGVDVYKYDDYDEKYLKFEIEFMKDNSQIVDKLNDEKYIESLKTMIKSNIGNVVPEFKGFECEVDFNDGVDIKFTKTAPSMSDEEFKRMTEAATDALTDMELKGYDIECKLRGVENVHLNNSKRNNNK